MVKSIRRALFKFRKKREIKRLMKELELSVERISKNYTYPLNLCMSVSEVYLFKNRIDLARLASSEKLPANSYQVSINEKSTIEQ